MITLLDIPNTARFLNILLRAQYFYMYILGLDTILNRYNLSMSVPLFENKIVFEGKYRRELNLVSILVLDFWIDP